MSKYIEQFYEYGIKRNRGSVVLFTPTVALDIIDEAQEANVPIIGVDAFLLHLKSIQPFSEFSIDLSGAQDGAWDVARELIKSKLNTEFLFELDLTEPNEEIHKREWHYIPIKRSARNETRLGLMGSMNKYFTDGIQTFSKSDIGVFGHQNWPDIKELVLQWESEGLLRVTKPIDDAAPSDIVIEMVNYLAGPATNWAEQRA